MNGLSPAASRSRQLLGQRPLLAPEAGLRDPGRRIRRVRLGGVQAERGRVGRDAGADLPAEQVDHACAGCGRGQVPAGQLDGGGGLPWVRALPVAAGRLPIGQAAVLGGVVTDQAGRVVVADHLQHHFADRAVPAEPAVGDQAERKPVAVLGPLGPGRLDRNGGDLLRQPGGQAHLLRGQAPCLDLADDGARLPDRPGVVAAGRLEGGGGRHQILAPVSSSPAKVKHHGLR
jgi:hypothetical protein